MLTEVLKSRLCRDLLEEVDTIGDLVVAITSFAYPNGDSVNLFVENQGDELVVSDEGTTLRFLRHQNVELTKDRQDIIKAMCASYGVEFQLPRLVKRCDPLAIGIGFMEFCEAVMRISSVG